MARCWLGVIATLGLAGCPSRKEPAPEQTPEPTKPEPMKPEPTKSEPGKPEPGPAKPEPVDPRAPRMLTSAETRGQFGVGPGYVYWCDGREVRGVPKNGDTEITIGACGGAFQFMGDRHGIYYCGEHGMYRGNPGNTKATQVAALEDCILGAVDNTDVYFIVPGFEGVADPGLYRLPRAGGDPVRVLPTRKGEQISLTLDGGDLWITSFFAGTIQRLAKAGGKPITVVSGQRSVVDIAADARYLYWIVQQSGELRRRPKTGGAIDTLATTVGARVIVQGKAVYWTEGAKEVLADEVDPAPTGRVMKLAPGAKLAEPVATGLLNPDILVDDEGLYVSELRKPGVRLIPH